MENISTPWCWIRTPVGKFPDISNEQRLILRHRLKSLELRPLPRERGERLSNGADLALHARQFFRKFILPRGTATICQSIQINEPRNQSPGEIHHAKPRS